MPVSLREVADRAGLSRATISRILNDRATETRISEATQRRVREIAEEIGYRPNRLAQSLSKGRTNIISLMIPGLHNPFFLGVLEAAEIAALEAGYDVLPDTAFQMRTLYSMRGKLSGWPVDGILAWMTADQVVSQYTGGASAEVPTVYMGYRRTDGADYVAVDRNIGIRQLMEHLLSTGYRRVAYLYPWQDLQPVDVRYSAYEAICAEFGQVPERLYLETTEEPSRLQSITQAGLREAGLKTGLALAARPKEDRPDAIVCHNDLVAIGLYHGLTRGGVRVPEDTAVAGFDGISEGQFMDKPLTTVVSPGEALVNEALRILKERLEAGPQSIGESRQVVLASVLRVGGTT